MKITHIFAQNFCKFYGKNTLDTDFSMKTVLSGQNEVGKSTVNKEWLLANPNECPF